MSMTSAGPTRRLVLVLMGWLVALTGCSPASIPDQALWEQRISEAVADVEGVEEHELDIEFSGAYGKSAVYRIRVLAAQDEDVEMVLGAVKEAVMPVVVQVPYLGRSVTVECTNAAGERKFGSFSIAGWALDHGIEWPPEEDQ